MARKKQDSSKQDSCSNTMTDSCGEWKKGDDVWYTSWRGEVKYGTIMYFSENSENEKKWVTLWDLTDPRYESAVHRNTPTRSADKGYAKQGAKTHSTSEDSKQEGEVKWIQSLCKRTYTRMGIRTN